MPSVVKGLELARTFYAEVIRPLVPVSHAACLIGEGSEVLGYDTERSTDHEWGPRLQLFVAAADVDPILRLIDEVLPDSHRGYPTRWFSLATGQVGHHVEVGTTEDWLATKLPTIRLDPDVAAWLAVPQQHLLQLTAGAVFHDDLGVITRLRATYRWYPADVWRWMISSQWHLIGNTEPLIGRTIETGDHRGAWMLTGRLSRLIMEMAFLQERRYRPYAKWFGRAFSDLEAGGTLGPLLDAALAAPPAIRADGPLQQALVQLAERHNRLELGEPVIPLISDFAVQVNDAVRPYPVLNTGPIIDATTAAISDPALRNLPRIGSIDQLTHADDQLINFTSWPGLIADCYRRMLAGQA